MSEVLAIVAHPDDAELLCGGTLAIHGARAGILDLTAGESGSAGTVESRAVEAGAAARVLGVARWNAGLPDGAVSDSKEARLVVAGFIRKIKPKNIITHWPDARHPDHAAAAQLARHASFLSGLKRLPIEGEPHRPQRLAYALAYQETTRKPTFVVDISAHMQTKLDAIFAYGSQFEGRESMGDVVGTGLPLRERILAHHAHYGAAIRVAYGEPFWTREPVGVARFDLGGGTF